MTLKAWAVFILFTLASCPASASQRPSSFFENATAASLLLGPAALMSYDGNGGLLVLEGVGGMLGAANLMGDVKPGPDGRPHLSGRGKAMKVAGALTALTAFTLYMGYPFWSAGQAFNAGDVPRLNRSLGWGASVLVLGGAAWLDDKLKPARLSLRPWPGEQPGLVASLQF